MSTTYREQLACPPQAIDLAFWRDPDGVSVPDDELRFLLVPEAVQTLAIGELAAQVHRHQAEHAATGEALTLALMITMGGLPPGVLLHDHLGHANASPLPPIPFSTLGVSLYKGPDERFAAPRVTQDAAVALSGQLKTLAVAQMKIANDLRWMNSGPLAGIGEITLEALQPGSSIMPGKVNPVIPEATAMVAAQVIGNDAAITIGGQAGNFELNVMLPMIAHNLLQSIAILSSSAELMADKAIATFTVNEAQLTESLARNPILVTALNPIIGYAKAAEIAKQAYAEQRPIIEVALEQTDLPEAKLRALLDPTKLTQGGL